jgi:preprotein translocase subunit SecD
MNSKIKKILLNYKVIILLFLLILSVVAINPNFSSSGVSITSVVQNSSANIAGITSPSPTIPQRNREVVKVIQGQVIETINDYHKIIEEINEYEPYETVEVITSKNTYLLTLLPEIETVILSELEDVKTNITEEVYDEASGVYKNLTIEKVIQQNKTREDVVGIKKIGLEVKPAPFSNIRKGLDLEGGTRVILQPKLEDVNESEREETFEIVIMSLKQRLNVYGLSDIKVTETVDLSGKKYILVEIPGVNQEEVKDLISKQGKFEAKINDQIVFSGGGDIRTVHRSADRAGIDSRFGCQRLQEEGYMCRFYFGIILSNEAAQRMADVTKDIKVVTVDESGNLLSRDNQYLESQLKFLLDDKETNSLNVASDLKGRAVTDIQISGSGIGRTEQEAVVNTLKEMKEMQTVLITGSLPVTLEIIKADTISPSLGKEFLNNAILIGFISVVSIAIIIFLIYRKISIVIPIIITIVSELILILGFAASANWNLDLSSIAAIIIVIGTGVDHLIIMTDETMRKSVENLSWLQKLKRAFGIILIAGLTTSGAMVPLLFAGAGMLKGFALTTIVGVIIGVLIARPAYAAMIEILLKNN